MAEDPISAGLNLGDAIVMLIKGVIPTTPEQVACMQKFFPVVAQRRLLRAQRIKERQIQQAADWVKLHKIDPVEFARYVSGDSTFADLVRQDVAGMK